MDWDSHRYLELFFAVPCSAPFSHGEREAVPGTDGLTIDHAADSVLLVHPDFLPMAESLAPRLPAVRTWITLSDGSPTGDDASLGWGL